MKKRSSNKKGNQSTAGRSTLFSSFSPGDDPYTNLLQIANASLDELAPIPHVKSAGRLVRLQLRDDLRIRHTSVNYAGLMVRLSTLQTSQGITLP